MKTILIAIAALMLVGCSEKTYYRAKATIYHLPNGTYAMKKIVPTNQHKCHKFAFQEPDGEWDEWFYLESNNTYYSNTATMPITSSTTFPANTTWVPVAPTAAPSPAILAEEQTGWEVTEDIVVNAEGVPAMDSDGGWDFEEAATPESDAPANSESSTDSSNGDSTSSDGGSSSSSSGGDSSGGGGDSGGGDGGGGGD